MPITSILSQPDASQLKAAYRPITFIVKATNTDGTAIPPVVYCDVYFNGVFYKTVAKTHFKTLNSGDSDWKFDIQDPCQEVIAKRIGPNGGSDVIQADDMYKSVYCKFRSSGYNTNGFITPEGTAPIQGTGLTAPVAGTGTQSNTFYILNAALQHANNQDLGAHLNHYKNGTWASDARPLTHRPNKYKIGITNTDFFPFWYGGTGAITGLRLSYKVKGGSSFTSAGDVSVGTIVVGDTGSGGGGGGGGGGGSTCAAVAFSGAHTLPDATVGVPYSASFALSGDGPFTFSNIVKPGWMTISESGGTVSFSGTPVTAGTGVAVSFDISNCSGANTINFSDTIDITAADVNITGLISTGLHSVQVNLSASRSCSLTLPIHGTYVDGGLSSSFDADIVLGPFETFGEVTGIVGDITCIQPTLAGTNILTFSDTCGGQTYVYTLTIDNPC